MGNETFTAGVEPGGLTTNTDIKILICHVLREIALPITQDDLLNALTDRGYANYFESADAISDLLAAKLIAEDAESRFTVTDKGRSIAETLSGDLPLTVRERVAARAFSLARRKSAENDNKVTIEKQGDGGFLVRCSVCDRSGGTVFALELTAPSRGDAQKIRDSFLDKPAEVIRANYELLTGEPF